MKIGTTIFLTILILISYGYIISDDLNIRKRLTEVSGQINEANKKLGVCQETVDDDKDTISKQSDEIRSLKFVHQQQTGEIQKLEDRVTQCANTPAQPSQVTGSFSNAGLLIAIAILISLVVLAVFQKRQETKISYQIPSIKQHEKGEYVRITKEELAKLVNMRRMKKQ
jgi:predicted PurR-regulated permease PerM